MTFALSISSTTGTVDHTVVLGETLFILGANGTGKSSLMQRFYNAHHQRARRVTAHRQTWFTSNAITLTAAGRRDTESNMRSTDTTPNARWRDDYSEARSSIAIYDLIDAENVRAREIAGAVDIGDFDLAKTRAKRVAPIKVLNELLRLSNIPVEIEVQRGEQVLAKSQGGFPTALLNYRTESGMLF